MAGTAAFSSESDVTCKKLNLLPQTPTSIAHIENAYELERCCKWIKNGGFVKVALQFPDELLIDAAVVQSQIQEKVTATTFILGDTSYGSCCVDEVTAEHFQADSIIHFGPTCLSPIERLPVLLVLCSRPVDIQHIVEQFTILCPDHNSKVILMADSVYQHAVVIVHECLREWYSHVVCSYLKFPESASTGDLPYHDATSSSLSSYCKCSRLFYLPKEQSIEEYSVFYIGSEGLVLTNLMMTLTRCAFLSYDPMNRTGRRETLNVNKALMKRFYMIERAKDASIVGIVAGTLGITRTREMIKHIRELAKSAGKKTYTFVVGKLNVAKLANFMEVDIFVLVACPQNTLLDSSEFFRPIITPFEMEVACNQAREWTGDYITDFQQLLPGATHFVPCEPNTEEKMDVSLISNKMRVLGQTKLDDKGSEPLALVVHHSDSMALAVAGSNTAGEFLAARSWQGLERKLGETPVQKAKEGLSGIAMSYQNELQ